MILISPYFHFFKELLLILYCNKVILFKNPLHLADGKGTCFFEISKTFLNYFKVFLSISSFPFFPFLNSFAKRVAKVFTFLKPPKLF